MNITGGMKPRLIACVTNPAHIKFLLVIVLSIGAVIFVPLLTGGFAFLWRRDAKALLLLIVIILVIGVNHTLRVFMTEVLNKKEQIEKYIIYRFVYDQYPVQKEESNNYTAVSDTGMCNLTVI